MDPLTAGAVKAVAELLLEIIRGQPDAMRVKAWERWEQFQSQFDPKTRRRAARGARKRGTSMTKGTGSGIATRARGRG
jgi:hypothetical protein